MKKIIATLILLPIFASALNWDAGNSGGGAALSPGAGLSTSGSSLILDLNSANVFTANQTAPAFIASNADCSTNQYSFSGFTTWGLFLGCAPDLRLMTAGSSALTLTATAITTSRTVTFNTSGATYALLVAGNSTPTQDLQRWSINNVGTSAAAVDQSGRFSSFSGSQGVDTATAAYAHLADKDTGITFPAADQVGIQTAATTRMIVDASGNVGISTNSPTTKFQVAGTISGTVGTSTVVATMGGRLYQNFTSTSNAAGTDTTFYSFNVTSNTLATNGDSISFKAAGAFAGTVAVDKRIRVKFGATTVFDSGNLAVTSASEWTLEGVCYRTGATTQKCYGSLNTSFASLGAYADYSTVALTLANSNTFSLTGSGTNAADSTGEIFEIGYERAGVN